MMTWQIQWADLTSTKPMHLLKRVSLALVLALAAPFALARDMPVVDPANLATKYGMPDTILSTEYDKPRPPMVSRLLEYKRAGIRIALVANAPAGSPPPYSSWLLLGYQDLASKTVIPQAEAERRLASAKAARTAKP